VEIILDIWNLEEGQDRFSFMERMITDDEVDCVLIISDAAYAAKANERKGGVGDETQIITPELYRAAKRTRFIPVVTEYDQNGQATLPVYLRSRIYIDFSQLDRFGESYERLLRAIWDVREHPKPPIGRPPDFVLQAQEKEPLRFYSQREEAVEEMLRDISRAEKSLRIYCRVYYSELVRRTQFERIIAAIADRRPLGSSPFLVRQVTTDPDNEDAVQRLYHIEDSNGRRWSEICEFRRHLRSNAIDRFRSIHQRVCQILDPSRRAEVRFEYAFYDNYLSPYSFVLIDGSILYASFHTLNLDLRYGRDMPTVRITPGEQPLNVWFERFSEEIDFIEQRNIARETVLDPAANTAGSGAINML